MKQALFHPRKLCLCGVFAVLLSGLVAGPAGAAVAQAPCSPPLLSQPFIGIGDLNAYMLAPGQDAGGFNGSGWTLSGGARILVTRLAFGQYERVLDLPSGARAVSPSFCVQSNFPTARVVVNDVTGHAGVAVSVSNNRTGSAGVNVGVLNPMLPGWLPSYPFDTGVASVNGQQHVQFTFTAAQSHSEYQLYNFYVDPRMKG